MHPSKCWLSLWLPFASKSTPACSDLWPKLARPSKAAALPCVRRPVYIYPSGVHLPRLGGQATTLEPLELSWTTDHVEQSGAGGGDKRSWESEYIDCLKMHGFHWVSA